MPYRIKKVGNKYAIIKKSTGKVVGHSDTKEKAEASVRARYANSDEPSHERHVREYGKLKGKKKK